MSNCILATSVLAEANPSQISATMVLIVLVLVTVFIVLRRKPDEVEAEDIPPVVTFQCESCGEDLNADDAPCPMCGGRVLRMETPAEAWSSGSDVRDSR